MERILLHFHGLDLALDVEAYHHVEEDPDGRYIDDWWEVGQIVHNGQEVTDPSDALCEAIESYFTDRAEARYEASITP